MVHEDDRVRVTTILVDHGNMAPALAYRFDCDSGAVVFSGDTAPSSNLVRLATGADILVHEVIDPEFGRREFGEPPYPDHQRILIEGIYAKHLGYRGWSDCSASRRPETGAESLRSKLPTC